MKNNVIQKKSYRFSLNIINFCKLVNQKREYELAKQLLRSGTSIGANVEEAIGAQSKKDFIAKMYISSKEARETYYWIRLLNDSGIVSQECCKNLLSDCNELIRILSSILMTLKTKIYNS